MRAHFPSSACGFTVLDDRAPPVESTDAKISSVADIGMLLRAQLDLLARRHELERAQLELELQEARRAAAKVEHDFEVLAAERRIERLREHAHATDAEHTGTLREREGSGASGRVSTIDTQGRMRCSVPGGRSACGPAIAGSPVPQ